MRLPRTPQHPAADPLSEIPEWADELQNAVVTGIDPLLAADTAQQAAAASISAAASFATVAGAAAGAATGGSTMTSATAAYSGAAGISTGLGSKIAAWVLAGATVTGGLAATGHLPDAVQGATADLAGYISLELPRPELGRLVEMVDVGSAGTVSLEVADGVLSVVDLAAVGGWQTAVEQQANGAVKVIFTGADEVVTMTASVATDGTIRSSVSEVAAPTPPAPATVGGEARLEGSVSVSEDEGAIEIGSELEIGGSIGLGN
jgi:hypothetical protein